MRSLAQDVWIVEQPLTFLGAEFGARMTVIRLGSGELVVISPVKIDDSVRARLDALGPVKHIVCPNSFHHLFAKKYKDWYPAARVYAVADVRRKRPDLPVDVLLDQTFANPWQNEIEVFVVRGSRFCTEAVFYHRQSKVLVLTDMAFNFQRATSLWEQFLFRALGAFKRFGPSITERLVFFTAPEAKEAFRPVLDLDVETVVMAHGDVKKLSDPDELRQAFRWLVP